MPDLDDPQLMSHSLGSRISSWFPKLTRCLQSQAALRPVPPPRGDIRKPEDFLKRIGRDADKKLPVTSWSELWKTGGLEMRKAGVGVRDRRYILWAMEKYRQGLQPEEYAFKPKSKKKIRGRGPAVQNGKVNRSKRKR